MQHSHSPDLPVARLAGNAIAIAAFGREWRICRDANLEDLWEAMGEGDFQDERIPYWAELWPASLGLGQWLYLNKSRIEGKHCLDLGCGLGFTALIAAWLGAPTLACDYEMVALRNCATNAALNRVSPLAWICMDWRAPAILAHSLDFIWGADIIYERRSMAPVLELLAASLAPGGVAWLAEPGRGVFTAFVAEAKAQSFNLGPVYRIKTASLHEGIPKADVTIWEASRK